MREKQWAVNNNMRWPAQSVQRPGNDRQDGMHYSKHTRVESGGKRQQQGALAATHAQQAEQEPQVGCCQMDLRSLWNVWQTLPAVAACCRAAMQAPSRRTTVKCPAPQIKCTYAYVHLHCPASLQQE